MGREYELKYQADSDVLQKIQEKYGDFLSISMETVYYDTPARALHHRRWMLRLRKENAETVCTLKTPLLDGSRGEWEAAAGSIREALPRLLALGAPQELSELLASGAVPVCGARFTRLAKILAAGDSVVELALDQGVFLAGAKSQPFAELEVELKRGAEKDADAFAQALTDAFSLVPQPLSKVSRAIALAEE